MSDLKLYFCRGSCALVPQILLHHADVTYEPLPVPGKDLGTASSISRLNPKNQVPVFVWDGEPYTEVPAIAHAINLLRPDAGIFGKGPEQFVRVCEWLNFLSGAVHAQAWGVYARPQRFTDEPGAEEGVKRKALERLQEKLQLIEDKLRADGWAVGESFTAADAFLFVIRQWSAGRAGIDVEHTYPKWWSLTKRVEELDAVQKAIEEEQYVQQKGAGF